MAGTTCLRSPVAVVPGERPFPERPSKTKSGLALAGHTTGSPPIIHGMSTTTHTATPHHGEGAASANAAEIVSSGMD